MTDDLHGWRTAAYKATRERDEALATIARVREFAASNALQPWVRERLADALDPPPPACPRCHGRGKVPDWSQGLDAEFGEPQAKPCPDCQAEPCGICGAPVEPYGMVLHFRAEHATAEDLADSAPLPTPATPEADWDVGGCPCPPLEPWHAVFDHEPGCPEYAPASVAGAATGEGPSC